MGTPKILKWGSKMRPPFLNDLGMKKGGGTEHKGSPPESLKPLKYRRFRSSVPVKKHARSSLKGGGGFLCRALMIRAVPNNSVPRRARILVPGSWYQARHGTEIFGTARMVRARVGNPPPPVKGGTGVFLTRHGTSESPESERL